MKTVFHILVVGVATLLCGAAFVTWETPQNLLALIFWIAVLIDRTRAKRSHITSWSSFVIAASAVVLMAAIITAAVLAPVKRIDAVLQRNVELPATDMTLAELADYCMMHRRSLPLHIILPTNSVEGETALHFSSMSMSLQQFIAEIEPQIGSRHRFGGCGNAYTVLRGPAYNFGLDFYPESDAASIAERGH